MENKKLSPIEHMRLRPTMYGYLTYMIRDLLEIIVHANPQIPKNISIIHNRDSMMLRVFGQNVESDSREFISSKIWLTQEGLGDFVGTLSTGFYVFCLMAWGKHFRIRSFHNGVATQISFKQSQFQKESVFSTKQADGWEIYFKIDPALRGCQEIIDFEINSWLDRMIIRCAAFYPQYNFDLNHRHIPCDLQQFWEKFYRQEGDFLLGTFRSEKIDCIIGYRSDYRNKLEIYSFVNGFSTPRGGTHEKYFRGFLTRTCRKTFSSNKDLPHKLYAIINYKENFENIFFTYSTKDELGSAITLSAKNRTALKEFIIKNCLEKI